MILRRGKHTTKGPIPQGHAECELCGQPVPIGPDGRCGLGHRVRSPETPAVFSARPVEPDDPGQADPAAPHADSVPEQEEPGPVPEPEGPGPVPAPSPADEDDPFEGLYGVIGDDPDTAQADPDGTDREGS